MFIHRRRPHEPRGGTETPRDVVLHRRRWLQAAGVGGVAAALAAWQLPTWWNDDGSAAIQRGSIGPQLATQIKELVYPAGRDPRFIYDRPETTRGAAASYNNFYEFTTSKSVWRYVDRFEPHPWSLTIDGLCRAPLTLDLSEFLYRYKYAFTERQYRHRCVERWAMAVPWLGLPLRYVLQNVDPLASATHVRFVSFTRPNEAGQQRNNSLPWPYCEGLTIDEAQLDLVLLAVGMYGEPLLKQHGAPLRLVVPWKYGYKSIKSIERIELIDHEPSTFWSSLYPAAYSFESNVDPRVAIPWRQVEERMLGTGEMIPTQLFNGYGNEVGKLYTDPKR